MFSVAEQAMLQTVETGALPRLRMYIGGEWVEPASGAYLETVDPFTARPWALVPRGNAEDADRGVRAAHEAFRTGPWRKLHPSQRARLLHRLGTLIEENADALAEIEVRDNGRLLAEMRHQIRYVPNWFFYYAGLADKIEGTVHPCDKPALSFSRPEPLGVCVCRGTRRSFSSRSRRRRRSRPGTRWSSSRPNTPPRRP